MRYIEMYERWEGRENEWYGCKQAMREVEMC